MEFRVLGPLEVVDGDRLLDLGRPRQRALLACLLVHANEVVTTERLREEVWRNASTAATNPLQVAVSRLRKTLGTHERLVTRAPGYVLVVEPGECDRDVFERLVSEGRQLLADGKAEAAAKALREALTLWRGPPFADFLYEPFAQAETVRLEEARLGCLESRLEADLALGRHAELIGELEALTTEHPLRERFRGQLMVALYRSGRQADALTAYQTARRLLVEELGIEPSSELRELHQAILRQDPELALPARREAAVETLASDVPERGAGVARKTVTVLVAEVSDEARPRRVDPELRRRLRDRSFEMIAPVLRSHGAAVERSRDDRVVGVFGVPAAHEDDALRAARAAAELRAALAPGQLLRIGIDTGEVLTGDATAGDPIVTGDALDSAVYLQQTSDGGGIVISEATRRLIRDAVRLEPIDFTAHEGEPDVLTAWRLVELVAGAPLYERHLDAPLVGREGELAQLSQAFERARRERRAQLFTVFGEAGIGKTRLAQELARIVGQDASVLVGRCLSYGEGITYWPVREIVEQAASQRGILELLQGSGDAEVVAARLEAAIGIGEAGAVKEEVFWAVRRLLEVLARETTLVVVFEDVHWGEPTLLDLIEHLADWVRDAAVLLVCLARPELLDSRQGWGGGKVNATSILLERLSRDDSSRLIGALPAGAGLAPETEARIAAAADGNPLFLEQMLAMLAHDEDGAAQLAVPPAIQALLAARLDSLDAEERRVLECASVEGEAFHVGAVVELVAGETASAVKSRLLGLVRKELIQPESASLLGEDAFRFRHALIRDAAYERLPKEARSVLHERYGIWLAQALGDHTAEGEEFLGYHFEQACRYRVELGDIDTKGLQLAHRACRSLLSAGRQAFRRGDTEAAVNLLDRARSVSLSDEAGWLELAPDVGYALFQAGEFERARRILDDAIEQASASGDRLAERHAWVVRDYSRLFNEPDQIDLAEALRDVEASIELFQEARDDAALSRAWNFVWHLYQCVGEAPPIREIAERSLAHAKRAGSAIDEAWSLALLVYSLLEGPTPVDEAVLACERLLQELSSSRLGQATVNTHLAPLLAMQGRFEEARAMIVRGRADIHEFGMEGPQLSAHELAEARVETLADDPAATERAARAAAEHSGDVADSWYHAVALIDVARSICDQDMPAECMRLLDESETYPAPPDVELVVKRPATRALALARLGRFDDARVLAKEAVSNAEGRGYLNYEAGALLVQAEVLRLSGDLDEARAALGEAVLVLDRKGNTVLAARTRAMLEAFAG